MPLLSLHKAYMYTAIALETAVYSCPLGARKQHFAAVNGAWPAKTLKIEKKTIFDLPLPAINIWLRDARNKNNKKRPLQTGNERRIEAFEMQGFRQILRVSRTAKRTNDWALDKTGE